jgi:molecular chaperone GrpE
MMSKHEDSNKDEEMNNGKGQADSSAGSGADSNPEAEHMEEVEQDAVEALQLALKSAQEEAAANLDGWQRSQADFMNYKKRIEREQIQMRQDASMRVIRRFLEVVDDLDRAMANLPADSAGAEWMTGIDLVYRKLMNILESEGVTEMKVEGQQFDPNLHEAISLSPSPDHESGQIIEVLQKGYMIGDRVLRPAQVRVAS